jgi:hypothetical protein
MNSDLKKVMLIFGGGILIFLAFKKIKPIGVVGGKSSKKNGKKEYSEEDKRSASVMLKAYSDARAAGEKKSFLDEMNKQFMSQYNMKVYVDKGSNKLFVADNEGNKVK